MDIVRAIVAVVLGAVIGSVVNMALVVAGPLVIPPPPGADMKTAEGLAAAMPLLTARHFVFPFLAHALGTFAGALVAYLVAGGRRAIPSWVVGVLFLAGGIAAAFMIPAPAAFIALDLVGAYLPMAWLAIRLGSRIAAPKA
ncbi:MAG TPA: hypothetical protein PLD37_06470 [Usitatibacteraceae bacterium]|nr:hypothetical protein [Usitatibacteraceae bacterium]